MLKTGSGISASSRDATSVVTEEMRRASTKRDSFHNWTAKTSQQFVAARGGDIEVVGTNLPDGSSSATSSLSLGEGGDHSPTSSGSPEDVVSLTTNRSVSPSAVHKGAEAATSSFPLDLPKFSRNSSVGAFGSSWRPKPVRRESVALNDPSALGGRPTFIGFRRLMSHSRLAASTTRTLKRASTFLRHASTTRAFPLVDSGNEEVRAGTTLRRFQSADGGLERGGRVPPGRRRKTANLQRNGTTSLQDFFRGGRSSEGGKRFCGFASEDVVSPTSPTLDYSSSPTTEPSQRIPPTTPTAEFLQNTEPYFRTTRPALMLDRELDPLIHYPVVPLYANFAWDVGKLTQKLHSVARSGKWAVPVKILHSRTDPTTPFEGSYRLACEINDCSGGRGAGVLAELYEIGDSLHNPHIEEGCCDQVHEALLRLVEEVVREDEESVLECT